MCVCVCLRTEWRTLRLCHALACPCLPLMGEQPLFEMVALAAHVRAALSVAGDDTVAGDEERDLATAGGRKERITPKDINKHAGKFFFFFFCKHKIIPHTHTQMVFFRFLCVTSTLQTWEGACKPSSTGFKLQQCVFHQCKLRTASAVLLFSG